MAPKATGGRQGGGGGQKPKNWRCPHCSNTDNAASSYYCSRPTCCKPWEPVQNHQQQNQYQHGGRGWGNWAKWWKPDGSWGGWGAEPADEEQGTQQKLREARDTLKMLTSGPAKLPDDHPTIAEYAQLVHKLEHEQAASVSTEDRLRDLLAVATTRKSDKEWADAEVGRAVVTVKSATKLLKDKLEKAEKATADFKANTLEIAELTRPAQVAASPTATASCPMQEFRAKVDRVSPEFLVNLGASGDKFAEFFRFFSNVNTALDHAIANGTDAPPLALAAAFAPAPASAPIVHHVVLTNHATELQQQQLFDQQQQQERAEFEQQQQHAAATLQAQLLAQTPVEPPSVPAAPAATPTVGRRAPPVDETAEEFSGDEVDAVMRPTDALKIAEEALAEAGANSDDDGNDAEAKKAKIEADGRSLG